MISAIDFSQQLIRIPSYSGDNPQVIELLKNTLQKIGFECKVIEFDGWVLQSQQSSRNL